MAGTPDAKEMIAETVTASSGLMWAAYAGFNFDPVSALGNEPGIMLMTGVAVVSAYNLLNSFGIVE